MKFYYIFLSFLTVSIISCTSQTNITKVEGPQKVDSFADYWYQSKAELTSYELQQARYGEIHRGQAATIFVTEPFNTKKQVKADNAMAPATTSVLKLNQTRKFNTGIYPYSTMTSSFTPVDISGKAATLKVSSTIQEWCGQVFMQMNKKAGEYDVSSYSYFESESDTKFTVPATLLEDEIFNLIRINPEGLPLGNQSVLPSAVYLRFMHKEVKPYKAVAARSTASFNEKKVECYTITYPNINRTLNIYFQTNFPFEIEGWTEEYKGFRGNTMITIATKKNQLNLDYWNKNSLSDSTLYNQLFEF